VHRKTGRIAYLGHMFKAFEFCIPTKSTIVPDGPDWLHQIKYGKISMSRCLALVIALLLAAPVSAYGQLTPPAGSAGAGNSPISGVPFGPANPRMLSDPSGIGNASSVPRLGRNPLTPVVSSTPSGSSPRVVALYAGASQRIISANQVHSRKPRGHGHHPGRPQVSKFTGICRGC
jgi:hypothetical protein